MGLIYLDTCLVIYAFEDHPRFGSVVRDAMGRSQADQFAISPLVRLECMVAPVRDGNLVLQAFYEEDLDRFVQLPMDAAVFAGATRLRARFGLKTPDALHLAAAQHHGCTALWTNDDRLAGAAHGLAVNLLAAT